VEIQDRGKALKNWIPVFTGMTEKRRERLFKRPSCFFAQFLDRGGISMVHKNCSAGRYLLALICLVTLGLLALGLTSAQAAYPDRPIKRIVPWAAGGDTDAICRVIASNMEKHLGKP
jgi:hypothetical protein